LKDGDNGLQIPTRHLLAEPADERDQIMARITRIEGQFMA
jgi:hypothetical protein